MKILVSKLKPNPFRRIDSYPVDKEKVEALKASIEETTFWDNILARPAKGGYEIAYGHHRLEALKELKIKEIDIPIRDIDDAMMIRIMANENRDTYKANLSVMIETIKVARDFLRKKIANGWNKDDKSITIAFQTRDIFERAKSQGVGRDTIKNFLGGNWKEWEIQEALAQLDVDKEKIEPKALDQFESLSTAREARQVFQEFKIPKSKQTALAKEMVKKEIPVKHMRVEVANVAWREGYTKPSKVKEKESRVLPSIDEFITTTMGQIGQTISGLEKLQGNLKNVNSALTLMMFNTTMKGLKRATDAIMEELETLKTNKGGSDGKVANLPENRKRIANTGDTQSSRTNLFDKGDLYESGN